MKYYLAIDIGASSGRHIVGYESNGKIETQEVYRFPNFVDDQNGYLIWDIRRLLTEIKKGIKEAFLRYPKIESLAIDTWGVDYVLIGDDGEEILPCYAYRDGHTATAVEEVHSIIPFEKLYEKTGTQFQTFNTIYRLWADKKAGRLNKAAAFLMMPEYFSYKLTGVMKKEYTDASTTGLINAASEAFDPDILSALGYPQKLFPALDKPGVKVGALLPEIAEEVGGQTTVLLCASHDTASAFEAVKVASDCAVLSSGTWSLLGAKLSAPITTKEAFKSNFANEGGVGYVRFLKNIMGLWIIGELRKEFGTDYAEMVKEAKTSRYEELFDVNDQSFLAPKSMSEAIKEYFTRQARPTPEGRADLFNTVYRSLALSYKNAMDELEKVTGRKFGEICIVGGGAKNGYLNELTATFTGRKVTALPIEATAIGNLMIQIGG